MAEEAVPAPGGTAEAAPRAPPPEAMRDELLLKFVGTGTLIVGIVLLVSSVIAISILSVLTYDIVWWLPALPLSLLVILVGGLVGGHYRRIVNEMRNPKPPEKPAAQPTGYPYPYPMPAPYAAPPGYAMPYPYAAPPQYAVARGPYPMPPAVPNAAARRACPSCGRPIPLDSRFCPYCRHVLA